MRACQRRSPRPSASTAGCDRSSILIRFLLSLALIVGMVISLSGCQRAAGGAAPSATVRFLDIAPQAGVTFRHTNGQSGRYFIAETMGSGCAFLDYNGDGQLDLFLANSSRLPGYKEKGPFYPALYHNEGAGKFVDVTKEAGLALDSYGMGVAVADYDNDGDPDLLLTSYGGSHLFRNEAGRFTEVTKAAGVGKPKFGTSAAWFDYDRDGHLDLFICNYLNWAPATNQKCGEKGNEHICGPQAYAGVASVLYHSNGDGTFTDVTRWAGVAHPSGKALGVVVWDVDDDGWLDFAVANDTEPNWLFHNNKDGTFTEKGIEAGIAYAMQGSARSGMGIDTTDFDHSGREVVLIGNNPTEGLAFFQPTDSSGHFTDGAEGVGLFQPSLPYSTFGARFLDADLDGYPEILTANGHPNQEIARNGGVTTFEQRMLLFHNEAGEGGQRHFRDVTTGAGPGLNAARVGRGLAVGDVDGDGDPDVLVNANNGPAALLENQGAPKGRWLAVRLIGTKSNREGIGARVLVTVSGQTQRGWVRSGGSFCSEDERVARFGLGEARMAERVEVRWPSGTVDRLAQAPAGQTLIIREGQSSAESRR